MTLGAMDMDDPVTQRGIALNDRVGSLDGFIGGVIKHLDVELVFGIVQPADGVNQAIDHELLVEDGELDGDPRQICEFLRRLGRSVPSVLVIHVDQDVAMNSVTSKNDEDDKVGNQEREVEGIRTVERSEERCVGKECRSRWSPYH